MATEQHINHPEDSAPPIRVKPARRGFEKGTKSWLTVLLVISGILGFAYQVIVRHRLEQTTALFVGLPLLLGFLVVHLTRTRGAFGRMIQVNILFLAIVAPLLGEGAICLIMAAPLFIGFSALGLLIWPRRKSEIGIFSLLLLPVGWGALEQHTSILAPDLQVVETTFVVNGSLPAWRDIVREAVPLLSQHSPLLGLGFPTPEKYERDADRLEITFSRCEGVRGRWLVRRESTASGTRFVLLDDSTKMSHWLRVIDSEVMIELSGSGDLVLRQRTRFEPLLSPHWYFVPLQRRALREAHALARTIWAEEASRVDPSR